MRLPKIIRPEFEISYNGILGFCYAIYAICKVGIQKAEITVCPVRLSRIKRAKVWIIPKYKLTKSEVKNETD